VNSKQSAVLEAQDRHMLSSAAADLIAKARLELGAGRPAQALVIGRELHWLSDERYEAGRDALAAILEVHHAHRDLGSVDVYAVDR
jgi:hypothetical protein